MNIYILLLASSIFYECLSCPDTCTCYSNGAIDCPVIVVITVTCPNGTFFNESAWACQGCS